MDMFASEEERLYLSDDDIDGNDDSEGKKEDGRFDGVLGRGHDDPILLV